MASTGRREQPATAKRAAIQAAVLKATEDLLAEGVSFADLGIEKIATRAGISRTAFYFYFADKRELLMRLTEEVNALLFEQADVWFSSEEDPEGELHTALANIAELYDEHRVLLRAIVEVSTYDEEVAVFWRSTVGRFAEATRRRIEQEQAAGTAAVTSARATAFSLTWMTERTLYQQLVQDLPMSRDELVDALTEIWVRGVYSGA